MIETVSLREFDYRVVLGTPFSIVKVFQSDHFLILCCSLVFVRLVIQ